VTHSPSNITTSSVLSILGSGFSPAAADGTRRNQVWLVEGSSFAPIGAGSSYWYESPTQINVALPPGIAPGNATVHVTNAAGVTSNTWSFQIQAGAFCGNGVCEPGENGTTCGADCCDQRTPCNVTYRGQGVYYCRSMNGGAYGWTCVGSASARFCPNGAPSVLTYCEQPAQACGGTNVSTYACGGQSGVCGSIPNGWASGGCP
jgi:hypothetical protein